MRAVPRLNLFSDQYETPKSLPYDSQDLNSLTRHDDPGEDSDEVHRVDTFARPAIKSGADTRLEFGSQRAKPLNHSFSANSSEGSISLKKK